MALQLLTQWHNTLSHASFMCTCPCHNTSNLLSAHNPSHQRHKSCLLVKSMLKSWENTLPCANIHSYIEACKGGYVLDEIPFLQQEPSPPLVHVCERTKGSEQLGEVWKALLNVDDSCSGDSRRWQSIHLPGTSSGAEDVQNRDLNEASHWIELGDN